MEQNKRVLIALLAAGSAKRMGQVKQLLKWKDRTLIEHCLKVAFGSNAYDIIVVLGANAHLIKAKVDFFKADILINENWTVGISSSIILSIKHAQKHNFDAVLFILADQPYVSSSFLNKIILAYLKGDKKIIASRYSQTIGVPALYDAKYFPKILDLKGDKGAQSIILKYLNDVEIINADFNLLDIDNMKDYKNLIN